MRGQPGSASFCASRLMIIRSGPPASGTNAGKWISYVVRLSVRNVLAPYPCPLTPVCMLPQTEAKICGFSFQKNRLPLCGHIHSFLAACFCEMGTKIGPPGTCSFGRPTQCVNSPQQVRGLQGRPFFDRTHTKRGLRYRSCSSIREIRRPTGSIYQPRSEAGR